MYIYIYVYLYMYAYNVYVYDVHVYTIIVYAYAQTYWISDADSICKNVLSPVSCCKWVLGVALAQV